MLIAGLSCVCRAYRKELEEEEAKMDADLRDSSKNMLDWVRWPTHPPPIQEILTRTASCVCLCVCVSACVRACMRVCLSVYLSVL